MIQRKDCSTCLHGTRWPNSIGGWSKDFFCTYNGKPMCVNMSQWKSKK